MTVFDVFVEDEIGEVMKFHLSVWLFLSVTMDLTFIVDTFIRCFRAFRRKNGTLVSNLSVIRLNYMKSHEFIIDIAASVPFDLLLKTSALVFESSALYHLRFLRLLRLLRLARAYRSLKSSYFYEEIELKFHSAKISLCLVFIGLILMCHWAACVFTWVAREEAYYGVTTTWIDMALTNERIDFDPSSHGEVYIMALYWAVVSITSVGYGDIVPARPTEYLVATVLIFFGGGAWAFVIGTISGIVSNLNHDDNMQRKKLDSLNLMLREEEEIEGEEKEIGDSQRAADKTKLRHFIHNLITSSEYKQQQLRLQFNSILTPSLQEKILWNHYGHVVMKVREFQTIVDSHVLNLLVRALKVFSYPKQEIIEDIPTGAARCVVLHGVASVGDRLRILAVGSVFGEFGNVEEPSVFTMTFFQIAVFFLADIENIEELKDSLQKSKLRGRLKNWAKSQH